MKKFAMYQGEGIVIGPSSDRKAPVIPTVRMEDIKKGPFTAPMVKSPDHEGASFISKNRNDSITSVRSTQLPPLAADLEGLAVSLGVLAGNVSSEQWEFLKIFRANLRAAAERVAALENNLEVPHERH